MADPIGDGSNINKWCIGPHGANDPVCSFNGSYICGAPACAWMMELVSASQYGGGSLTELIQLHRLR